MSIPRFAVIVFVLGLVPVVSAGQETITKTNPMNQNACEKTSGVEKLPAPTPIVQAWEQTNPKTFYLKKESAAVIANQILPAGTRVHINDVIKLRNAAAADVATAIQTQMSKDCRQIVYITAEPVTNTVLISASPEWYPKIRKMVEELDAAPNQVSIKCMLAEVDPELIKDFGVELKDATGSAGFVFQFRDSNTVNALVRALKTQGRIDILNNPNLQTLDNQTAIVSTGQIYPYVTGGQFTTLGTFQPKIAYRTDVGVTLQVTPRIDPEGRVLMRVESSVIKPIATSIPIGNGLNATAFTNQAVQRTILADDGETVVIGGLICTEGKKKKQLIIVLTPHIIRGACDADQISAQRAPAEMINSTKPIGSLEPIILPTPHLVRPLAGERTAELLSCPKAKPCKAADACPACTPCPESCHGKMSLADVAALSTCKVSDVVIVNQMRTTNTVFCLSAEEIIWLKKNGVSDWVVMETQNSRLKSTQGAMVFGTPIPTQP